MAKRDNDSVNQSADQAVSKNAGLPDPKRRALVKAGIMLPTLGAASLLAACGGDDDNTPAPGKPNPEMPGTNPPDGGPAPTPDTRVSSFGLVVLPDTQFYSRYATPETGNQFDSRYGSEPFMAQTTWLAQNAEALKIPFVIHVGDVVDQVSRPQQWTVANAAMKVLEDNRVPYSILAGNHDVLQDIGYESDPVNGTDATRVLANEPYLQHFTTSRASQQATFGGRDASGFHEYHIFEAEGQKFLVLSLSWRVSDDGIAWARNVLAANPTLPCIVANHQLIAIANDGVSPLEVDYGLMLWDKLIRDNDQIFMTVNGHHHGSAHLTKINDFGHAVEQMVVDYQMAYQGGNGLLRFYEFDMTNNEIRALSFSPWVVQKPVATLNSFDQAMLTEPTNQFTIKMNFAERFGGFNKTWTALAPSAEPLAAAATAMIMNGFNGTTPPTQLPAKDDQDYPKIAETLAHWRFFGGAAGGTVADLQVIPDASGNGNDLQRAALTDVPGNTAQLSDLTWSDDRHRLSSAPGSIQFSNSRAGRVSYFLTDAAAAMNGATFPAGYTVEAFIKIDKSWAASTNAWMNIMTREGRRGDIPGWTGGVESPPAQFAISNLREVQWEVATSANGTTPVYSRTNWSGEILIDSWLHVAVVNDPVTKTTTMYVEGAPVLRNAIESLGLASMGLRWLVGAGFWNGGNPNNGFLGAIGEVRVVSKPLEPAEWLTARA